MDFLDPKKQRSHRIRLFIGYGLMAIALGFGTMILFLQSSGLNLNPRTGEVTQNGLLFVDAHPAGADVWLNGENRGRTDARLDLPVGKYDLELSQDGYRNWKRSFTLEGASIERLVYPFLFPTNLEISDVELYASTPGLVTQSPDRRWVLVQQPGGFQTFGLIDLNSEAASSSTLALPQGLLETSGETHKLELVEWSTDNRHVVLKHLFDGGEEFFVVDIESVGSSVNLTRTFGVPFTALTLRDKKFDQYYLYNQNDKTLAQAVLSSGAVTPVVSNVLAFSPHGSDVLVYVTTTNSPAGKVTVMVREGTEDFKIRELPADSSYVVEVARFNDAWYFAAGSAAEQKVYVYKNPVSFVKRIADRWPVPVGVLRLDAAPESVSFSANARFMAAQAGGQFSVYDAETDRQYRYDTGLTLLPSQKATWMDGHRLSVTAEDKVIVFDYDGINIQRLSAAANGTVPMFDRDYTAMFAVGPSVAVEGRSALIRTELVVDN